MLDSFADKGSYTKLTPPKRKQRHTETEAGASHGQEPDAQAKGDELEPRAVLAGQGEAWGGCQQPHLHTVQDLGFWDLHALMLLKRLGFHDLQEYLEYGGGVFVKTRQCLLAKAKPGEDAIRPTCTGVATLLS